MYGSRQGLIGLCTQGQCPLSRFLPRHLVGGPCERWNGCKALLCSVKGPWSEAGEGSTGLAERPTVPTFLKNGWKGHDDWDAFAWKTLGVGRI